VSLSYLSTITIEVANIINSKDAEIQQLREQADTLAALLRKAHPYVGEVASKFGSYDHHARALEADICGAIDAYLKDHP
jgi:hypothetical protein